MRTAGHKGIKGPNAPTLRPAEHQARVDNPSRTHNTSGISVNALTAAAYQHVNVVVRDTLSDMCRAAEARKDRPLHIPGRHGLGPMPPWVVAEDPLQVATWRAEATRQVDVDYDREVQMVTDRANQDRRLLHFVKEREASVTDPRRPPLTFPEPPSFASKETKLSYKEDEHSILSRAEHTLRVMVGKRAAPPEALPILQTCIDNVRVCLGDMMGIKQPASPLPLLPKDTTGMCQSEGPLSLSGQDMKDRKACIRRNDPSRRETMRRCLSATCTRVHLSVQKGMPQGQIEEERQVLRHLLAAYEGGLARNLGSHQLQLGMLYQTERIKELQ